MTAWNRILVQFNPQIQILQRFVSYFEFPCLPDIWMNLNLIFCARNCVLCEDNLMMNSPGVSGWRYLELLHSHIFLFGWIILEPGCLLLSLKHCMVFICFCTENRAHFDKTSGITNCLNPHSSLVALDIRAWLSGTGF